MSTAGVAYSPKVKSINEKNSAMRSSDLRQKMSRATAKNTTATALSSATL